ncbi:MAG TPA: glycosyltransferase family 4 protein [Candidatus Binatia bacterium]|nr:glycosyltransferase family 4 protein [Candidatus Binatia bacterium]
MSARVRVLSIIDDLGFGGDENRLLSFATTIDRERFEHRIVTIQPPHSSRSESWAMHQHYNAAGVRPSSLRGVPGPPVTAARNALHIVGAARRLLHKVNDLRRVLREWRADVIDAHLEPAALVSVLAGAASRTATAVTLYSPVPLTPSPLWPVVGHLVMGMASVIVTDSQARRHDITRWMRRPRRPVLVVPNGIAPPQTARPADEIRAELGIPRDPGIRVIGQVAGLAKHKGHVDLLEAARRVLALAPSTMFLLVGFPKGDITYRQRLERMIRELGLGDRIRLVSYPGPIGDVWKVIDIQVHASTYDSLPNALIEGMALAKPIVATTVGGVPDMLKHLESALLVPPHDPGAIASALLRLVRDPALAARLGAAAHRRYRAGYQPAVMTRALEGCFAELATRRRRRLEELAELRGST